MLLFAMKIWTALQFWCSSLLPIIIVSVLKSDVCMTLALTDSNSTKLCVNTKVVIDLIDQSKFAKTNFKALSQLTQLQVDHKQGKNIRPSI